MNPKAFTESKLEILTDRIDQSISSDGKNLARGLLAIAYSLYNFSYTIEITVDKILEHSKTASRER